MCMRFPCDGRQIRDASIPEAASRRHCRYLAKHLFGPRYTIARVLSGRHDPCTSEIENAVESWNGPGTLA